MVVVAPVNYSQACRSSAIPPNPQSECLFSELTTSPILPCPSFLFFLSFSSFLFFPSTVEILSWNAYLIPFLLPWKEYFFTLVADLWYPNSVAASTITHQYDLSHLPPFSQGPGFFPFFFPFSSVCARERGSVSE